MPVTIQPATLKYKNSQGNYQSADSIKGDKGDKGDGIMEDVTVSGATPSITGVASTRYLCGEVSTISITPPSSGIIDVVFTSGTTATVLTVPNTVKFPPWFDASSLEASMIYEINIADGTLGVVATWQA